MKIYAQIMYYLLYFEVYILLQNDSLESQNIVTIETARFGALPWQPYQPTKPQWIGEKVPIISHY